MANLTTVPFHDGAITNGAIATGAVDSPLFWLEESKTVSGNNKVETATAYGLVPVEG